MRLPEGKRKAALLAVTLSGCGGFRLVFNPEELYALPELPAKYTELNAQLNAILEDGAEYAAPTSGSNIQPVQLTDLDGDGQQEAVAFFRKAEDEKPLKIYIFSAKEDSYEQSAVIEGSGASVYSVVYTDLDGDGRTEIIVGWRVNAELQALSVYALDAAGPQELLRSVSYVRYASIDLDGDGLREMPDGSQMRLLVVPQYSKTMDLRNRIAEVLMENMAAYYPLGVIKDTEAM